MPPRRRAALAAGWGCAALLLILPAVARADEPRPASAAWKSHLEYLTHILQDGPSRIVRDHIVSLAAGSTALTFEYADGGGLTLALDRGEVRIDGRSVGRYPVGGALEAAWRRLAQDGHPERCARRTERC